MRKGILSLTAGVAALSFGLTACGGGNSDTTAQGSSSGAPSSTAAKVGKIGVILPDSKSSARWETADRKYLDEAFKAAGVQADIQNAQGDKNAFQTIADQMITNGATVLMIVNLDSGTGKAVLDKAKSQGVATIDYDRLTLGGSAAYYVSFDNTKVGQLQGEGLVKCLTDKKASKPIIAELNGSPTDNNATLFKDGYDGVLKPKYDAKDYVKGPDQSVPDWDNAQAGTIFEQMLTSEPKIAGVLAANDGLGNAAITVLKRQKLNGKVPVTGQDATVQGLQNILAGDQCMTVYKAIKKEANAASALAIALAKGEKPTVSGSVKDPEGNRDVPSVLETPQAIFFDNVKDVVADGFVTKADLCTADFAAKCTKAGIS
jgi:D-xylose transport system substrate-binding protein